MASSPSSEAPSPHKIIGGKGSKIARHPSELHLIPERSGSSCSTKRCMRLSNGSSSTSSDDWIRGHAISSCNEAILKWEESEVVSWLHEIGFAAYEPTFKTHAIRSGSLLLALEESHLKEMGVLVVGHRLEIMEAIHVLRREAGLVSKHKFINLPTLLMDLERLREERAIKLYPKRVILIRHAESEGNVDNFVYSHKPDSQLKITERGRQQADTAGVRLKELIGDETVSFYVSPFVRSKETYTCIREHFSDDQVIRFREEPRVREQEWGNFQDPKQMAGISRERRKVGSFFYRFPTGESGADVYDRVSTFLESFHRDIKKGSCGDNTIIVSHGLFCRLFLTRYYHWTIDKFHKLWNFDNCQFAVMEKQPNGSYELITELKSD